MLTEHASAGWTLCQSEDHHRGAGGAYALKRIGCPTIPR